MVDVRLSLVSALACSLLLVPPVGGEPWAAPDAGEPPGVPATPAVPVVPAVPRDPTAASPDAVAPTPAPTGPAPGGAPGGRTRLRWQWPLLPRPPVLRPFSAPLGPYGPGHRGVDLGATAGSPVLAVEEGVVTHAGHVAGRGTVTVTHADGLSSTYEPVRARVVVGTPVATGDVLGDLEAPDDVPLGGHCLLAACLHLGARRGGSYLDPLLLLRGGRVRLLPLRPAQSTTG